MLDMVFDMMVVVSAEPGVADDITWESTKALVRADFPDVTQRSVSDLVADLEGPDPKPLLIDVREPGEYAVSQIPGAVHAQGAAVEDLVQRAGGRPVILYCSVGYRSARDAQALLQKGSDNVSNLEGSIFEWANEEYTMTRGGAASTTKTEFVHPYNESWGTLLHADRRSYTPR